MATIPLKALFAAMKPTRFPRVRNCIALVSTICLLAATHNAALGDSLHLTRTANELKRLTPEEIAELHTVNVVLRGESEENSSSAVSYSGLSPGQIDYDTAVEKDLVRVEYLCKVQILTSPAKPIRQGGYADDTQLEMWEIRCLKDAQATTQVSKVRPYKIRASTVKKRRQIRSTFRARAEALRRLYVFLRKEINIVEISFVDDGWDSVPIPQSEVEKSNVSHTTFDTEFLYLQPIPDMVKWWNDMEASENATPNAPPTSPSPSQPSNPSPSESTTGSVYL